MLGEITTTYRLDPRQPRFLRFFGWSMALFAVTWIPATVVRLTLTEGWLEIAMWIAILLVTLYIRLRFTLLFPAIAIDAPGATDIRLAFADTHGHFWRIFFVFALALLPILAAFAVPFVAGWWADKPEPTLGPWATFWAGYWAILFFYIETLTSIVAARLFQALADRVLQPPGASPTIRP